MSRYALNLPAKLKSEAEELAAKQGVSLNQFIMWSVSEKVTILRQTLDDPNFPGITSSATTTLLLYSEEPRPFVNEEGPIALGVTASPSEVAEIFDSATSR